MSLNGKIKKINGIIALGILAKKINKKLIIPYENINAAKFIGVDFAAFGHLKEVCMFISGETAYFKNEDKEPQSYFNNRINSENNENAKYIVNGNEENGNEENIYFKKIIDDANAFRKEQEQYVDFSEIKGQKLAKRAVLTAVAGHHNILMVGPPGSGKTMLAHSIAGIQPDLSLEESLETSNIYGFSNKNKKNCSDESRLILRRPFIAVHHTVSLAGLIGGGGGSNPLPGDISLAHNGVLFIDEFSELNRKIIDGLRQPMEDKYINLSRSRFSIILPSNFMLVAAMNPCPCGYYGDSKHKCKCSSAEIYKFYTKISGPILDRFDIFIEVYPADLDELTVKADMPDSADIKKLIEKTRNIQLSRYKNTGIRFNSSVKSADIEKYFNATNEAINLAQNAVKRLNISSRGYYRILRVSRTIADLDLKKEIDTDSVLEALNYRNTKLIKA